MYHLLKSYNESISPTDILPKLEALTGTNVKAKSLKTFCDNYNPQLSIRFSLKPLEYNQGLLNLPIYLAGMAEPYINQYLQPHSHHTKNPPRWRILARNT